MSDLKKIVERLDGLGKTLFNRYGTDSYTDRCILDDIKADILKINVTHSSLQLPYKDDDLLKAYQAGAIESKDDCVKFGYDDLKELESDSIKWLKRYKN